MSSTKTANSNVPATKKTPATKPAAKKTAEKATPSVAEKPKSEDGTPAIEPVANKPKAVRKKVSQSEETAAAPETVQVPDTESGDIKPKDVPEVAEPVSTAIMEKMIEAMLERRKAEMKSLKEDLKEIRDLKSLWNRQVRYLKTHKKRREGHRGGANRTPSGFAYPTRIRDALCDFLGLDHGSSIARTDVTRQVIKYVRDKKLEEQQNRRNIIPDEALEKLLGSPAERIRTMEERKAFLEQQAARYPNNVKFREKADKCVVTDKVSYFNIQVHLNKHFYKSEKRRLAEANQQNVEIAPVATAVA